MSNSFDSKYVGDLAEDDGVVYGREKLLMVDGEDAKLLNITVLEEYMSELLNYKTYSFDDFEVSKDDYASKTVDVSLNGYTPIGYLLCYVANSTNGGFGSSYAVARYTMSGTNAVITIRNILTNSNIKVKCTFRILYMKNI